MNKITLEQAVEYEIFGHWLASWIWFDWGQELMAWYITRKVKRKHKRYVLAHNLKKFIENN